MSSTIAGLLAVVSALASVSSPGQQVQQRAAIIAEDIASRVQGYAFAPRSTSRLEFRGTSVAPLAMGKVAVEIKADVTVISAQFSVLPVPEDLGAYTTLALWLVTPEGRAINLGPLKQDGSDAEIEARSPLSSFAMIVTAEPHFAVSIPSKVVVLQSVGVKVKGQPIAVTQLLSRADYADLVPQPVEIVNDRKRKVKVPVELRMARYSVAIAKSTGAELFASSAFERAQSGLAAAEAAFVAKRSSDRGRLVEFARATIQSGEDARGAALQRKADAEREESVRLAALHEAESQQRLEAAAAAQREADARAAKAREELALAAPAAAALQRARIRQSIASFMATSEAPDGFTAVIPTASFAAGKAAVPAEMREILARFAGLLSGYGAYHMSIASPENAAGRKEEKKALALQRAVAIRDYLVRQGASPENVEIVEQASTMPVAVDVAGRKELANERIEIVVRETTNPESAVAAQ